MFIIYISRVRKNGVDHYQPTDYLLPAGPNVEAKPLPINRLTPVAKRCKMLRVRLEAKSSKLKRRGQKWTFLP